MQRNWFVLSAVAALLFMASNTAFAGPSGTGESARDAVFCGMAQRVDPKSCVLVHQSAVDAPVYDITGASPKPGIGLIAGAGHQAGASTCDSSAIRLTNVVWHRTEFCANAAATDAMHTQALDATTASIVKEFDLKVQFPAHINFDDMPGHGHPETVTVPTKVSLTNNSGKRTLLTSSPCQIHNWEILDSSGRVIQRKPSAICIQPLWMRVLEGGATISDTYDVVVNRHGLSAGKTYTLRYSYWGFQAEVRFVVDFPK